jgi:hypothetical protein
MSEHTATTTPAPPASRKIPPRIPFRQILNQNIQAPTGVSQKFSLDALGL